MFTNVVGAFITVKVVPEIIPIMMKNQEYIGESLTMIMYLAIGKKMS